MQILVTGGAGFIGSNVVAAYLAAGHRVTVFDNLSRPGVELNLRWLRGLPEAARLRFVRGDVREPAAIRRAVGGGAFDLVFHFAAQTAVTTSVTHPRQDLETNLLGTFNVLEALRALPPAVQPALFYTSTNKVYGPLARHATTEVATRHRFADAALHARGIDESEPLDFHSPYGCSKGAADQYVRDYHRIYGLRTVVFRMSCIYGPRQMGTEDQGWLAHFMIAAALEQPVNICGDGKQVRDLLYVGDLVRAFQMAARRIDATAGQVYNIGGGLANSISIWRELQPKLEALTGARIATRALPWRPGDQRVYVTCTARAERDFGWTPEVGVDDGMARLWRWIAEQRPLLEGFLAPQPNGHAAAPESLAPADVLASVR